MEYRKSLLSAVSALALTGVGLANAALPEQASPPVQPQTVERFSSSSDAVLDFVILTNGDLSSRSAVRSTRELFASLSPANLDRMPAFVRGVRALGLDEEARNAVVDTLLQMMAESGEVDDATLDRIGNELLDIRSERAFQVAQLDYGDCDYKAPTEMLLDDPDCAPLTTEAGPLSTDPGGLYSN